MKHIKVSLAAARGKELSELRRSNDRLRAINAELVGALEEIAIDRLGFRTEGPWTAQGIASAAIARAKEQQP